MQLQLQIQMHRSLRCIESVAVASSLSHSTATMCLQPRFIAAKTVDVGMNSQTVIRNCSETLRKSRRFNDRGAQMLGLQSLQLPEKQKCTVASLTMDP